MSTNISFVLILCSQILLINCWPSGAPEQACASLQPSHGEYQSQASSPFVISHSQANYLPGDKVKVLVQAPEGSSFKGVMVQAYDPISQQPIGSFVSGRGLKLLDTCSAVTHSDRQPKRSAVLVWKAPDQPLTGASVAFRGTVVHKFNEFYTNVNSILASEKA